MSVPCTKCCENWEQRATIAYVLGHTWSSAELTIGKKTTVTQLFSKTWLDEKLGGFLSFIIYNLGLVRYSVVW